MLSRGGSLGRLVALGLGLAAGLTLTGFWPHTPLHAVSTDRIDTFAVATGYCDDSVEAVYLLDFLTGNLQAVVLSKQTGKFNAFFVRNVAADLGVDLGRRPRFLMTTGLAELRRTGGARLSPSRSILYIAEVTTGQVAAYSIPWSSAAWVAGQQMSAQILMLDKTSFRSAAQAAAAREGN